MAAISTMVLSEADATAGLAALEASLIFVLEGAKVPVQAQQILGHIGYTALPLFAKVGATEAEVKEFMSEDMLMPTSIGGGVRLARASLLVAWDTARRRVDKRLDEEAVQRASDGLPRPLLQKLSGGPAHIRGFS